GAPGRRPLERRGLPDAFEALVDDRLPFGVRRRAGRRRRRPPHVPAVDRRRPPGVRAAGVDRRLERRGARRPDARGVPAEARGAAGRARPKEMAGRGERGDDVPLGRGSGRRVVRSLRGAAARARSRGRPGLVPRRGRRRIYPDRPRPDPGGVRAGRSDPRGRPVSTDETIAALDRGELRVAERSGDDWVVNEETKRAIVDYFRARQMEPIELGPFEYHDKIPLKHDYAALGVRVVPPATARYGSFLLAGLVL